MKKILILVLFSIISTATIYAKALNGKDLSIATDKVLAEAAIKLGKSNFSAWAAQVDKDEVIVKVLSRKDAFLGYGCDYHNLKMLCEHFATFIPAIKEEKAPISLDFFKSGHKAALDKFERTMKRQGKDLSVMSELKVWANHEEEHDDHSGHGHHGHGHDEDGVGPDIWTKINYISNGNNKTIYILCHLHGHDDSDFVCHYRNSGQDEPTL